MKEQITDERAAFLALCEVRETLKALADYTEQATETSDLLFRYGLAADSLEYAKTISDFYLDAYLISKGRKGILQKK